MIVKCIKKLPGLTIKLQKQQIIVKFLGNHCKIAEGSEKHVCPNL